MESLLRWSIENSAKRDPDVAPPPAQRTDLDPGIIDYMLGKSDAQLMKEALIVAVDSLCTDNERVAALDDMEMLIESIDNANNIEKLKMWEPLQSILTDQASSSSVKMQTLWVIGTALQNNPSAQAAYLSYHPIPLLISLLDQSNASVEVRSKAVYTLSGLLKHNGAAVNVLDEHAWNGLRAALADADINIRRKTIFLLNSLIIPTPHSPPPRNPNDPIHANSHASMLDDPSSAETSAQTLSALKTYNVIPVVISSLVNPLPFGEDGDGEGGDLDYEEKAMRFLHTYSVSCRGEFSPDEKIDLGQWLNQTETAGAKDRWGLGEDELQSLRARL